MVSGRQFRKPKKRPSRERQDQLSDVRHEADLEELWLVLAEAKETNSWGVPWNRGTNAIALGLDLARQEWDCERIHAISEIHREKLSVVEAIQHFLAHPNGDTQTYWTMQDHLSRLDGSTFGLGDRLLRIAVRMVQLYHANSHGGGVAYNTLLIPVWDQLDVSSARLLRRHRCADALDIDPDFTQVPIDDRLRRAFYTAWDRGLYQVAYAVGGSKKTQP